MAIFFWSPKDQSVVIILNFFVDLVVVRRSRSASLGSKSAPMSGARVGLELGDGARTWSEAGLVYLHAIMFIVMSDDNNYSSRFTCRCLKYSEPIIAASIVCCDSYLKLVVLYLPSLWWEYQCIAFDLYSCFSRTLRVKMLSLLIRIRVKAWELLMTFLYWCCSILATLACLPAKHSWCTPSGDLVE
jgi:hypothetical protein